MQVTLQPCSLQPSGQGLPPLRLLLLLLLACLQLALAGCLQRRAAVWRQVLQGLHDQAQVLQLAQVQAPLQLEQGLRVHRLATK